jgi:hypothetical protein
VSNLFSLHGKNLDFAAFAGRGQQFSIRRPSHARYAARDFRPADLILPLRRGPDRDTPFPIS